MVLGAQPDAALAAVDPVCAEEIEKTRGGYMSGEANEQGEQALELAQRHIDEKQKVQREAKEDWDLLQGQVAELLAENKRLRTALDQVERIVADAGPDTNWRVTRGIVLGAIQTTKELALQGK
jgi:hypothetical protein